jgi:MFS superfamily sulfate permease-like transporter
MIIVALRGMFMQFAEVPFKFRESAINFSVWSVTFLTTVFLDIEYGLGIGILASLLNLIWRSNQPQVTLVSLHSDSDDGSILVDSDSPYAKNIPGIKIVKYAGSLNFATVEYFAKKVQSLVPAVDIDINPTNQQQPFLASLSISQPMTPTRGNNNKVLYTFVEDT